MFVCSTAHKIGSTKKLTQPYPFTNAWFQSFFYVCLVGLHVFMCVRACLCFCVSDPDSYHFWHKVVVFWRLCSVSCCNSFPVMAERTSAPRCSQPWLLQYLHVYAHNFHLLFLEQSAAGAWREAQRTAVSRAQLGFHDWEAGPDYARLGQRGGRRGGLVFSPSRPFQGFWLRAGGKRGLWRSVQTRSQERSFTSVRSFIAGL